MIQDFEKKAQEPHFAI